MDRDWLYYSVPVTTGRNTGPMYRFWNFVDGGAKALCIEYWPRRKKPSLVALDIERVHISQRPADPPPMPDWAKE